MNTCRDCGKPIAPQAKRCTEHAYEYRKQQNREWNRAHPRGTLPHGNPHRECVAIDVDFMHRVYDARDDMETTLRALDEMVGKAGKDYIRGTFDRLRLYGSAKMHKDQHTILVAWLEHVDKLNDDGRQIKTEA
jgi:hypothetical protein